jgi:hypothetical protein
VARPSKINQQIDVAPAEEGQKPEKITVAEAIVQALRAGAYIEDAAESAGVAESTVYAWIARGQEHAYDLTKGLASVPKAERPYVEFAEAVEKARASAVVYNLALIRQAAAAGNWKAAAWWLERTRPGQYGRQLRVDANVKGKPSSGLESVDLSVLEDDEVEELERLTAKIKERSST